ncbi:MAG TPA: hypothetical protein VE326_11145 [Candidatus Binatia bacterium]|nr:hypothetical protein [Candidatus Binatia bacterium]
MTRLPAAVLCEATCAARGRHQSGCVDEQCPGCLRRKAADGLRLCPVHAAWLADDARGAPDLYADLGLVLVRRGRDGERMSGSPTGAPVPDDDVMDARLAIRVTLINLAKLICTERGVTPPVRFVDDRPYLDSRPDALGEFVAGHAEWLAAHPDAGTFADDLKAVTHGRPYGLAYPSGSDRLYIGDCPLMLVDLDGNESVCGARLYQLPDRPLLQCPGCGTDETIEWWQRQIVGTVRGICDAYAVAAHLALCWMRPVDPATIRTWAHRGHINPVTVAAPTPADPDRVTVVRDDKGRTQYVIAEATAHAEKVWGPPYRPNRTRERRRLDTVDAPETP